MRVACRRSVDRPDDRSCPSRTCPSRLASPQGPARAATRPAGIRRPRAAAARRNRRVVTARWAALRVL